MSRLRVSRWRRGNAKPSLRACVLVWQLNGEALPSLFATAAENCTSPPGFHARAKPVRLDAALVPGTICRLTHVRLQKRYERNCKNCKNCKAVGKAIVEWRIDQVGCGGGRAA